jgi:hypothetical protein
LLAEEPTKPDNFFEDPNGTILVSRANQAGAQETISRSSRNFLFSCRSLSILPLGRRQNVVDFRSAPLPLVGDNHTVTDRLRGGFKLLGEIVGIAARADGGSCRPDRSGVPSTIRLACGLYDGGGRLWSS